MPLSTPSVVIALNTPPALLIVTWSPVYAPEMSLSIWYEEESKPPGKDPADKFVNPLPSPVNIPSTRVTPLPVIEIDPVKWWLSESSVPNILLPEWFNILDVSKL